MQARIDNDELFAPAPGERTLYNSETTDELTDEQPDGTPDELFDDTIDEPFERIQAAVAQAATRVGQAMRAAWSRLVPNMTEPENDFAGAPDDLLPDGYTDGYINECAIDARDEDDTDDEYGDIDIIDDTDEHIIETDSIPPAPDSPAEGVSRISASPCGDQDHAAPLTEAPQRQRVYATSPMTTETAPQPDRLLTSKKRRRTTVHSPIAVKQNLQHNFKLDLDRAPKPERISTERNDLTWDRTRGILTIAEPILEDADPFEQEIPRATRRKRSVALTIRMLDERIVPILLGVINAIETDDASDSASAPEPQPRIGRHAASQPAAVDDDLPYVCESGANTFCWYRAARTLKIYGQKRVDDRGLLHSSKCVVLHVRELPTGAKALFTEILQLRARVNPYRAIM
ncbi:MAG: hypothetical protein LBK46_06875 [Oscillospiraceae bacterium]|jgi:hypothetical protein|nr:hypothetical protein [Oscillospiraceae bacterium]